MAEIDKNLFKKLLEHYKKELLEVEATGEEASQVVELDQTTVGRLSRMDAMQAQAMSLETHLRRKQALLSIDEALKKLEMGEFGNCLECGEMINPERLKSNLTATLCIECASQKELNI